MGEAFVHHERVPPGRGVRRTCVAAYRACYQGVAFQVQQLVRRLTPASVPVGRREREEDVTLCPLTSGSVTCL